MDARAELAGKGVGLAVGVHRAVVPDGGGRGGDAAVRAVTAAVATIAALPAIGIAAVDGELGRGEQDHRAAVAAALAPIAVAGTVAAITGFDQAAVDKQTRVRGTGHDDGIAAVAAASGGRGGRNIAAVAAANRAVVEHVLDKDAYWPAVATVIQNAVAQPAVCAVAAADDAGIVERRRLHLDRTPRLTDARSVGPADQPRIFDKVRHLQHHRLATGTVEEDRAVVDQPGELDGVRRGVDGDFHARFD